jgi:hypothetical protein
VAVPAIRRRSSVQNVTLVQNFVKTGDFCTEEHLCTENQPHPGRWPPPRCDPMGRPPAEGVY